METGDTIKWAESNNIAVYAIAQDWAKRFTTPQLRGFQEEYQKQLTNQELTEIEAKAYNNRWWAATWAISIREFGY